MARIQLHDVPLIKHALWMNTGQVVMTAAGLALMLASRLASIHGHADHPGKREMVCFGEVPGYKKTLKTKYVIDR